jgi:hypothetical protein
MADRRVEFTDIKLETELRPAHVPESALYRNCGAMDSASDNAGISIGREHPHENWLQDVHYRVVGDPVGKVRKTVHLTFFWLIHLESGIW